MAHLVTIQANEDADVDIIFVGDVIERGRQYREELIGHPDWFKEALPKRFTKSRSLYYKYEAQIYRDSLVEYQIHAAHDLLLEWAKLDTNLHTIDRRNVPSRPVIFVCQSSGGALVETALLLSETKEEFHALSDKTFGIILLGSPHASAASSPIASLRETPNFANHTESAPQTLQASDIDEEPTRYVPKNRRRYMPYIRVYFCQATSTPCPGARLLHQHCLWSMVPQLWLSESAEKHYLIPKTLSEPIKRANIERSISRLAEEAMRNQNEGRTYLQNGRSLLRMHLSEWPAASCEWFVNLPAYQKWANESESPLLWLEGRAGAGKSTLCSAIIKNLEERQGQRSAVAFCFFDTHQVQGSSARHILRAFACQLRDHRKPNIPERLLYSIIRGKDDNTDSMSLDQFGSRLGRLLGTVHLQAQAFFIVDGLDNDKGVQKAIMHEILQINRKRGYSHIFRCVLSSRFAFEARILPEHVIQIDLSTEIGHQQDMLKFATTRLADILGAPSSQMFSISDFAEQLCSHADGLFLWLALAVEEIQHMGRLPDVLRLLDLIPNNVDAFYQRALQQIAAQDVGMAQKVFSWLTVATRLLYLPELLAALAVNADHTDLSGQPLSSGNELSLPSTEAEIRRICGWLVTITEEGIVRLRHPTLRDYLLHADDSSKRSRGPVHAAHELLARSCLALLGSVMRVEANSALSRTNASQQRGEGVTTTLITYAATNWYVHYSWSETYSKILAGTLQRCLILTLDDDCQSFSIPNSGRSMQIANTTLRISASYGLVSLTRLCLDMGTDAKGGSCIFCETPLAIALEAGHSEVAKILLQGTVYPASIIAMDTVKSLLKRGSEVDAIRNKKLPVKSTKLGDRLVQRLSKLVERPKD